MNLLTVGSLTFSRSSSRASPTGNYSTNESSSANGRRRKISGKGRKKAVLGLMKRRFLKLRIYRVETLVILAIKRYIT